MSYLAPLKQPKARAPLSLWLLRFVILSAIGAAFLALLLAILLFAWQFVLRDRIMPGVTVGGVDLGGMTAREAEAALNEEYASLAEEVYILRDGERAWPVGASELGLRLAAEDMLARAFAPGHSGQALDDIIAQIEAWISGERQPLRLILDENAALDYLRHIATQINRDRQDAGLRLVDGEVQVHPGVSGRALNIPGDARALDRDLAGV